jgi:hypothetical protein
VRVVGVLKLYGRVKRYRLSISQIVTFVTILLFAFRTDFVEAQEYKWSSGIYSYFDNVEFGGSKLKAPQTNSSVKDKLGYGACDCFGSKHAEGVWYKRFY